MNMLDQVQVDNLEDNESDNNSPSVGFQLQPLDSEANTHINLNDNIGKDS